MKILKEYRGLLTHWSDILNPLVLTKQSKKIFALKTVQDFIDGFELNVPKGIGIRQLQRLLKEKGLDVNPPFARADCRFWV